jgi:3-hydroxyacyl-CoA dehydrogenase
MRIDEVRRVGQQIAFQCAGHGFEVVLHDVSSAALESARARIESYAHGLLGEGTITAEVRNSGAGAV